jgi:hypothetical protein
MKRLSAFSATKATVASICETKSNLARTEFSNATTSDCGCVHDGLLARGGTSRHVR